MLQNWGISAFGLVWRRRRFGGVFEKELHDFKARESFSTAQWQDYQTVKLRQLLLHTYETVPYYREQWTASGLDAEALKRIELDRLHLLPGLSKNALREQGAKALVSSRREQGGRFFGSSGSTGTPTQILLSLSMHQRISAAIEARVRHWAGLDRHTPRGMIGGRRVVPDGMARAPYYRYNIVEKQTYFSAYHLSEATVADYLEGMKKHGVAYMTGYAMSNYFLARFIETSGKEAPQLAAVLPSSEKLTHEMRQTFHRVYGCKTFDSWGSVESCGLVSECAEGRLHVSPDVGILEFLDPDTGLPAAPGTPAEVVCTGLLNTDQPLIRYKIGDMVRYSLEKCPCGREMPVITEISGRSEDTITGPDGRKMVRFHGIFISIPGIVEGQIVQHTLSEYEVKVVSANPLSSSERNLLEQRMRSQLGEVNVQVSEVATIPRGPNGKFKAVVSHLKGVQTA